MSHKRFHGVDRVTQTSYFTTFVWMARVGRAKLTRLTAARLGRIRRTACDWLIYYGGPNVLWTRSTPTAMMGFSDGGKRRTGQNSRVGVSGVGLTELSRGRRLCLSRVTTRAGSGIISFYIFLCFHFLAVYVLLFCVCKKSNGISKLWTFRFKITLYVYIYTYKAIWIKIYFNQIQNGISYFKSLFHQRFLIKIERIIIGGWKMVNRTTGMKTQW